MMKRQRKQLAVSLGVVLGILLVIILIAEGVSGLSNRKVDTSEGLALIEKAESADAASIENKIKKLQEKVASENQDGSEKEQNYKAIFANAVVMGDSISVAFTEYDYLNASSVVAEIGASLTDLETHIAKAEEISPQVIFLAYGMNDVISTDGDVDAFIDRYDALIKELQKRVPDAKLFVNSVFPVQEVEMEAHPVFEKLEDYNKALRELCDKRQISFIDNTSLVKSRYYEEDGIHFKAEFYPYWLDRMAEVAAL